MNNSIGLTVIAALGGAAVALQGQFMGMMDRKIGTSGALFVNYASGVLVAAIILLLLQGGSLKNLVQVPWYALHSGTAGIGHCRLNRFHSATFRSVSSIYGYRRNAVSGCFIFGTLRFFRRK